MICMRARRYVRITYVCLDAKYSSEPCLALGLIVSNGEARGLASMLDDGCPDATVGMGKACQVCPEHGDAVHGAD
jgi:hypothetical protein